MLDDWPAIMKDVGDQLPEVAGLTVIDERTLWLIGAQKCTEQIPWQDGDGAVMASGSCAIGALIATRASPERFQNVLRQLAALINERSPGAWPAPLSGIGTDGTLLVAWAANALDDWIGSLPEATASGRQATSAALADLRATCRQRLHALRQVELGRPTSSFASLASSIAKLNAALRQIGPVLLICVPQLTVELTYAPLAPSDGSAPQ